MRTLKWKWLIIIIVTVLALWQLHYSYVYFRMTQEQKENIDPLVLKKIASRALHLGLDLKGGMHIVLQIDKSKLKPEEQQGALDRALEIIRNRVDQFGVSEPMIQKQGTDRILVQLPGVINRERAEEIIGRTALLEFKLVADPDVFSKTVSAIDEYLKNTYGDTVSLSGFIVGQDNSIEVDYKPVVDKFLNDPEVKKLIPYGYEFLWGKPVVREGYTTVSLYLVKSEPLLTGDAILDAVPGVGTPNNPSGVKVELTMTRRASGKWAMITGANIGKRIAIVLDDIVQSAPVVRERIPNGRSLIEMGNSTVEDAKALAIVLKAGALPAPLKIVEERTIGPALGLDSIKAGARSFIIGSIAVLLFMLIYYMVAGAIADLALILNIIYLLAILSAFRATLTMPGIAGIILTVGMAVDANVLIFERLREELKGGKTFRTALEAAYTRVFTTILDANATTFIAAIILYWFGTGPVKGFAVTLSIGLVASFFTALFVTRTVMETISLKKIKSLKMLQFFKSANIDFLRRRKIAYYVSLGLIILSVIALVINKGPRYGVDFTGGYLLEVSYEKNVDTESIRKALMDIGFPDATIQRYTGTNVFLIKVKESESEVMNKIKSTLKGLANGGMVEFPREELVGPAVSKGLQVRALWVVFLGMIGILIYVTIRFTFRFGVASVVALFHDVFITLGIITLTGREFTIPMIAALLTILGYSINDSIVISDRIRENLKLMRRDNFDTIVNRSLNSTLGRTIITSLTTIFVLLALFLFGGRVIHDFSFALLIGVVVGTYSSIFVVAPIVVDWEHKKPTRRR